MAAKKQAKYVRNKRYIPLRLPFLRDSLAPRGQVGDTKRISPQTEEDELFLLNQHLFEMLTEKEAQDVWDKQNTNAQAPRHPALAVLRSETGKEYDEVKMRTREEVQGYKVAEVQHSDKHDGMQDVVRNHDRTEDVGPQTEAVVGSTENPEGQGKPKKKRPEEEAADLVNNLRANTKQGTGANVRGEK